MQQDSAQDQSFAVGQLTVAADHVTPAATVTEVYDRFSTHPALEALAIIDGGEAVGLITRTKLLFTLSRRFGYELFAKHSIMTVADRAPLMVFEDELLDAVVEKACARAPKDVYDEIIVRSCDGSYLGLLSLKELVIQQSVALTRSVLEQEVASARNKELERVNQVKSHFLATVTHELRSPVNAIVGLAQLLQMAADKGSLEQVRERLALLNSTAVNLRAVITNILDLSKIEAGKMEVARQELELVSFLGEIAETTRILVGEKPVSVQLNVAVDRVAVATDPMKLRQILVNLTSNAAKFTKKGSIGIGLAVREGGIEIEVRDTGIGIKEEDLPVLFTAFGQVEDAHTKSHEGTGLGLAISKNLARLIGAAITVESSYGKGTRFTLSLPLS
jgi:signal transduction histidine kinase